ncbi:MAG TPA: sialidase family protein [Thermoanaerobaculia bacterium]
MKRTSVLAVLLFLSTVLLAAPAKKEFPKLDEQLRHAKAKPGSALEKLIRENQDFSNLKDRDADDKIVPPWLKVYWRKKHAEEDYDDPNDPTGGYPFVLKEIFEWMTTHQDLKPGRPTISASANVSLAATLEVTPGANVSTSGPQTSSRSESDIRVNYRNPQQIVAASNNIRGSGAQGMYYSSDGGATWGQTHLPIRTGDSFHADPTVDWTLDGVAWSTTIGISGNVLQIRSYRSSDGGATWSYDGTVSGRYSNADKQRQWIDHSPSSPYRNHNYVIWRGGSAAYINRRTSAGWQMPVKINGRETSGSPVGGDVKTNAGGDVFGLYPDTGSRGIYAVKSTDGGAKYSVPVRIAQTYGAFDIGIPAFNGRRMLIYVSAGAYRNGTTNHVYALWADLSGDSGCTARTNEPGLNAASPCKTRVFFSRSTNGGATWSPREKINNQSGVNDQFNPALTVDETNGNLVAIYYDTVADGSRKKVDVYSQVSADGGATWQRAVKVTTAMTDETVAGSDSHQFGDYNGLSGHANVFFPSWTDRRTGNEEIWTSKIVTAPLLQIVRGSSLCIAP